MRWPALVGALLVTLASCGGDGGDSSGQPPAPPPGAGEGGLSMSVEHPAPLRSGSQVTWTLTVRNQGPPVTLEFSSGQSGDVVLRQDHQERYRWSAGRAFTQVFRHVPMGAGEVRSFRLEGGTLDVPPGAYQLVGSLNARPAPHEVEETVKVV